MIPVESPFHPDNEVAYRAWRDAKLGGYPERVEALIVELSNPFRLTDAEYEACWQRIAKTNMVIYATRLGEAEDKAAVKAVCAQFGLTRLDANWLADADGISSLTPCEDEESAEPPHPVGVDPSRRGDYIPYTHQRIRWHTDGYYNPPGRRIHSMALHCVRQAERGGENDLYDHELAYIALRETHPGHIRALMAEDAMTIPARTDETGVARVPASGPALLVEAGHLLLRYTARTRSIAWKDDPATQAALAALEALLSARPWGVFRLRLEPGMGLLCNNVLHARTAFEDRPGHRRLLYRTRYCDPLRRR